MHRRFLRSLYLLTSAIDGPRTAPLPPAPPLPLPQPPLSPLPPSPSFCNGLVCRTPKRNRNKPKGPNELFKNIEEMKNRAERERKEEEEKKKKCDKICIICGARFPEKVDVHGCKVDQTDPAMRCKDCGNGFFHDRSLKAHQDKCWNGWHQNAIGRPYIEKKDGEDKKYPFGEKLWY